MQSHTGVHVGMTWSTVGMGGSGCGLSADALEAVIAKHASALTIEHASLPRNFMASIASPPLSRYVLPI
jgi:hypothetical protein